MSFSVKSPPVNFSMNFQQNPQMGLEKATAFCLLILGAGVVFAYLVRVWLKGKAHYERVDQQGGSPFLGKSVMELGYWFFQPIARFLIWIGMTPNQISITSFFLGLAAGICLSQGHFGSGAVFSAFCGMMDALDGLVARMTGQSTVAGEILDSAVDRFVEFFFLGGLAIYFREVPVLLGICLAALMGAYMVSYSSAKAELFLSKSSQEFRKLRGIMRRPERAFYLTLGAALTPFLPPLEKSQSLFDPSGILPVWHPMVLALGLVAVFANFSALDRLGRISNISRGKSEKAEGEKAKREKEQYWATPEEKI